MKKIFIVLLIIFAIGGVISFGQCVMHKVGADDLSAWILPSSNVGNGWTNPTNAYDGNTATYANYSLSSMNSWTPWLELDFAVTEQITQAEVYLSTFGGGTSAKYDLDGKFNGEWCSIVRVGAVTAGGAWVLIYLDGFEDWTGLRVRMQLTGAAGSMRVDEAQCWGVAGLNYATEADITYLQAEIGSKAASAWVAELFWPITTGEAWVQSQGYLTSANLSGYATESWVNGQGYLTGANLSGYATESWVNGLNYTTLDLVEAYITALNYTDLITVQGWVLDQNYTSLPPGAINETYLNETISAWVSNWSIANGVVMGGVGMPLWFILLLIFALAGSWFAKSHLASLMMMAVSAFGFSIIDQYFVPGSEANIIFYVILICCVVYGIVQMVIRNEHL